MQNGNIKVKCKSYMQVVYCCVICDRPRFFFLHTIARITVKTSRVPHTFVWCPLSKGAPAKGGGHPKKIFPALRAGYSVRAPPTFKLLPAPLIVSERRHVYSTVQFTALDSKMCLVLQKLKNILQGRPPPPEILAPSDLLTP